MFGLKILTSRKLRRSGSDLLETYHAVWVILENKKITTKSLIVFLRSSLLNPGAWILNFFNPNFKCKQASNSDSGAFISSKSVPSSLEAWFYVLLIILITHGYTFHCLLLFFLIRFIPFNIHKLNVQKYEKKNKTK